MFLLILRIFKVKSTYLSIIKYLIKKCFYSIKLNLLIIIEIYFPKAPFISPSKSFINLSSTVVGWSLNLVVSRVCGLVLPVIGRDVVCSYVLPIKIPFNGY